MSEEEIIEKTSTEFNAGVATAMTVRELCNQAALARMQRRLINNNGELGYLDFLESLYYELINFLNKKDNKLNEYAEFYTIKLKAESGKEITLEEFQKIKYFEVTLREIAKPILMPGKKDPRWGGYG